MPKWTDAQREAIFTRGENLLVSAAAGSGKTAVLSARVGEFVEQGGRLDRLLIVTFTNAAAAEMRTRIARDLSARAAANPSDAHLRRQSLTLYKAKICTIDSYGMDLLRRNFQKAGVAPDFTVMDETELEVLKSTVLQRQIEEYYQTFPVGFGEFLTVFGGDTDSKAMETTIASVARKMETFPFGDVWLERQKEGLSSAVGWCATACVLMLPLLEEYLHIFDRIVAAEPFPAMDVVREEQALLQALCQALGKGDWDEVCRRVRGHVFPKAPSVRVGYPREAYLYKEYRSRLKKFLQTEEIFYLPSAQCERDLSILRPAMVFLLDAVGEFRRQITDEMTRRGAYSFSALAEAALRLAVKEYSHETREFTPTEIALEERRAYDEVLIDEYQDVNDLQDLFFRAVTDENCFAVGDVKQSIYGFRGANADNFLRKRETCKVIALNKNFRSRKGILDFVNFLCRGLFSPAVGGLVYDEREALFPGRGEDDACPYPPDYPSTLPSSEDITNPSSNPNSDSSPEGMAHSGSDSSPEGMAYSGSDSSPERMAHSGSDSSPERMAHSGSDLRSDGMTRSNSEDPEPDAELLLIPTAGRIGETHYAEEAKLCAKLIRDAVEGGATVYDKNLNAPRPMRYSDVAILLRYLKSAPLYEEEFRACGIPLLSSDGETFLDTPEVCGILAFLRAVNNPWDDLALFITLTGSVFSMSAQEVAEAHLQAKDRFLWDGLILEAAKNPRAQNAVKTLERFRILAENLPIPKLLWEIYTATDYLALESAIDPAARGNLMKFYAFACRYSRSDGLFGFLEFAERAKASGKVRESGAAPEGDFVRLTTIHKSKGLEYAWCILPEIEKNFRDDRDKVRVDSVFGIAPKIKNDGETAEYTTLMREIIGHRTSRTEISEELRVLYVALTRARDRLTVIGRCSDKPEQWDVHGLHSQNGAVRLNDLLDTNNFRTLILDRAVLHPDATPIQSAWEKAEQETGRLRVSLVEIPETVSPVRNGDTTSCGLSQEELTRRFSFRYDRHLTSVPAKVSVTEISKAQADPDSALLLSSPPLSKPKFLDETAVSATEAGTAIHTYCQFADFDKPVDQEIARLTASGHLTQATANAIDRRFLERFLESDLMHTLKSSLGYEREVRFTCKIPVSYYTGVPAEEGELLMQGAIDLLCELENGYLIVDFKSDRATEEELLQRYSKQLNLYAAAVRRLYDKPVIGCKIWAFRLGKALDVKEEDL
ncbi:MAG: UvrD-helicase domain-containing protein [Clostridia bacterium]|nr:UvrD-helicase domain-containing protein [Clostridia bacterium]